MGKPVSIIIILLLFAIAANGQTSRLVRALDIRPAIQRDAGHGIRPDLKTPISITSAASGYPEIAPGSYAIVSAPINRVGNGWAQTTQFEGVSVEIDGEPSLIYQLWKDGASIIASDNLPIGRTLDVVVTTPEGRYHGKVAVLNVAPGVKRGIRSGVTQFWPVGLHRSGAFPFPQPITDQPIPPTQGSNKTVVKVLASGFRRAQTVEVFVDSRPVPLIVVAPFFLPGEEEIAFELPEWLWGEDRLVRVNVVADGTQANPFWLRLPSAEVNR